MKLFSGDYFVKGSDRTIRFLDGPNHKNYQHFVDTDGKILENEKNHNNCKYKQFCENLLRALKQNNES